MERDKQSTEKIQQLRDYVMRLEGEKQEVMLKMEADRKELGLGRVDDANKISVIREELDNMKSTREIEMKNIQFEWKKVAEEKSSLEKRMQMESLKFLQQEKVKTDMEMKMNMMERCTLEQKARLSERVSELEQEVKEIKKAKDKEEQNHLKLELKELEVRKRLTSEAVELQTKSVQMELKITELQKCLSEEESEVSKLQQDLFKKEAKLAEITNESMNMVLLESNISQLEEDVKRKEGKLMELSLPLLKTATLEIRVKDLEEEIRKKDCIITNLEIKESGGSETIMTIDQDCEDETLQIIIDESSHLEAAIKSSPNMKLAEGCASSSAMVRCVLCPQPVHLPVPSYLFHIAREHIGDQCMGNKLTKEANQVKIFLDMLEDKAQKDENEIVGELKNTVQELREKVEQLQNGRDEGRAAAAFVQGAQVERLQEEVRSLEENLEEGRKKMEVLVVANRILKTKASSRETVVKAVQTEVSCQEGDMRKELKKLKDVKYHLEKEVQKSKHDMKDETLRKRKWRNRFDSLTVDFENVKKRSVALESDLDRFTEALVKERREGKQERLAMMARIRNLEAMTPTEVVDEINMYRQTSSKLKEKETNGEDEELILDILTEGKQETADERQELNGIVEGKASTDVEEICIKEAKNLKLHVIVKNLSKDESAEVKKYHGAVAVKEIMKNIGKGDLVKQPPDNMMGKVREDTLKLLMENSVEEIESDIEEINLEPDKADECDEECEEMQFDYSLLDSSQE